MIAWLWLGTASAGWTDVAVGRHVVCGAHDGDLICWGQLADLMLEPGDPVARPPTRIAALRDVRRVAFGSHHACVIDAARDLRCFGQNPDGQVGRWATDDSGTGARRQGTVTPAKAEVLLGDAVDVVLSSTHTCAATSDGAVYCWGYPEQGALGGADDSEGPGRVPKVGPIVELAVSSQTTCGRSEQGEVWCWGDNDRGILGLSPEEVDHAPWPVKVADVRGDRLALGYGHGCVASRSEVRCWGYPPAAEISELRGMPVEGDGGTCWLGEGSVACEGRQLSVDPEVPHEVQIDAVRVSVEGSTACAIDRAGALWCWGDNEHGTLGHVVPTERWTPAPVRGLSDVRELALGDATACALRQDGTVSCWGRGDSGTLGSVRGDAATPVEVPGLAGVEALAGSGALMCARAGGDLTCWGQAGAWLSPDFEAMTQSPQPAWPDAGDGALWVGEDQVCVADGADVACRSGAGDPLPGGALRFPDATAVVGSPWLRCVATPTGVQCGGHSNDGQSGRGEVADGVPMGPVSDLGPVEALAVGRRLVCALEAGAPRCWGHGALLPVRFAAELRGTDLDIRDHVACMVTSHGGVSCLGPGAYKFGEPETWTAVAGARDAVEIEVGDGFACARHRDGTVSCWGDARGGRLGDGAARGSQEPVPVTVP